MASDVLLFVTGITMGGSLAILLATRGGLGSPGPCLSPPRRPHWHGPMRRNSAESHYTAVKARLGVREQAGNHCTDFARIARAVPRPFPPRAAVWAHEWTGESLLSR